MVPLISSRADKLVDFIKKKWYYIDSLNLLNFFWFDLQIVLGNLFKWPKKIKKVHKLVCQVNYWEHQDWLFVGQNLQQSLFFPYRVHQLKQVFFRNSFNYWWNIFFTPNHRIEIANFDFMINVLLRLNQSIAIWLLISKFHKLFKKIYQKISRLNKRLLIFWFWIFIGDFYNNIYNKYMLHI